MKSSDKKNGFLLGNLKKFPCSVKITFIIMFVGVLQLHAESAYNQNAKLSLDVKAQPLTEVFNLIEKESGYLFNYLDTDVAGISVSVNVKNGDIRDVLAQALRDTNLTYSINNRHITIVSKEGAEKQSASRNPEQEQKKAILGTVVDIEGEPVIGANVIEKGTTNGTVTDLDGKFSLLVANNASIQISFIGYFTKEISRNQ